MENKSKKISKENKVPCHGRAKFEVEEGKYIADKLKALLSAGQKLLLNDIRKLMFKFSKEYISKGNDGKCPNKLGTTTIYTFLERHKIPAPQKARKSLTLKSLVEDSSFNGSTTKHDNVSSGPKKDSSSQEAASFSENPDEEMDMEAMILEAELNQKRKRIEEIEARLREIAEIKKNSLPFEVLISYSSQTGDSYDHDFLDLEALYEKEKNINKESKKNNKLQAFELTLDI